MSEHLSIRPDGEGPTPGQPSVSAVLIVATVLGALATSFVVYVMLSRHPFGWGGLPPELRALRPHATQIEIQHARDAMRRRELREKVIFLIVEGLLLHAIRRLRATKQAGAAAVGLSVMGAAVAYVAASLVPFLVGVLAGVYCVLSIKIADQWEKVVVLRFGRYHAMRGPGMFTIVPFIDRVAAVVDGRVRTTSVHAEAALTRDTVPVHVDAVIFWVVWNVEKAVLEVQDFDHIVGLVAQTALVESIGRHDLGEMIAERRALGRDLQAILEAKTTAWGITLQSVEIRDVRLPGALQDALSRQAQADRERQARIIFGDTEADLALRFVEASAAYKDDPVALHLRAMNLLYEAIKETGTMVVVPTSALRKRAGRAGLSAEAHSAKADGAGRSGRARL